MRHISDIAGNSLKEKLDRSFSGLPAGEHIDCSGWAETLTQPATLHPGQHLYGDGNTCFSVDLKADSPALSMNRGTGLHFKGVATGDNVMNFQARTSASVPALIATQVLPNEFQVSHVEMEGVTVGCEDGAAIPALVDLVNVTDRSLFRDLVISGGMPGIGLRIRTGDSGGASGQFAIENCTIGVSGFPREATASARPLVIELGKSGGWIATVHVKGGTIGHQGKGQAAIEINGHGFSGGIMGVVLDGVYTEIPDATDSGVIVADARGTIVRNMVFGSSGAQNAQDGIRLWQTTPYGTSAIIENIQTNIPLAATIRDNVKHKILTGSVLLPYYCKGDFN